MNSTGDTMRDEILKYAKDYLGTQAEYPWDSAAHATSAVLRHRDNKKWYGLVMKVANKHLGLLGDGDADVLNIKCDPIMIGSLRLEKGFLPAYHMNKEHWITVLLDGTVPLERILSLLDLSYELTAKKRR